MLQRRGRRQNGRRLVMRLPPVTSRGGCGDVEGDELKKCRKHMEHMGKCRKNAGKIWPKWWIKQKSLMEIYSNIITAKPTTNGEVRSH